MSQRREARPPTPEFMEVPYDKEHVWLDALKDYVKDSSKSFEERWKTLQVYHTILERKIAATGKTLDLEKKEIALGNRKQDLIGLFLRRPRKQFDGAGVVVIRNDDQVLYVKTPSGSLGFPKGHVDFLLDWASPTLVGSREEEGDETALREMKEESGFIFVDRNGSQITRVAPVVTEIGEGRPVYLTNGRARAYQVFAIEVQNHPNESRDLLVYIYVYQLPDQVPDPLVVPAGSEKEVASVSWRGLRDREGLIRHANIRIPPFLNYLNIRPHVVHVHPFLAGAAPAPWRPPAQGWRQRGQPTQDKWDKLGSMRRMGGTRRKRGLNKPHKS
jgi:8-oxo-dGTP pyrophosphatase MutT (NUDIX family)